jgi:2-keto-3-deoxy-L-rhamnonate aldolase RhmA
MKNLLGEKIRSNKISFGVTLSIGHPFISDIFGEIGFDFVNFDAQHAPLEIGTIQTMMQAMSYSKTTPIVRVSHNNFAEINSTLDIGAHGVIVPFVNTKQDLKKAMDATFYPPKGLRSYGPLRASMRDPEYMLTSDEEVLIFPQIETNRALDNMEDILSVEEIKAFFVGPYDLSRSLGVFTQWNHPIFKKAIERILIVAEDTGTTPGMLALYEEVELTIKRGFKLINLSRDTLLLTKSASSILKKARDK